MIFVDCLKSPLCSVHNKKIILENFILHKYFSSIRSERIEVNRYNN